MDEATEIAIDFEEGEPAGETTLDLMRASVNYSLQVCCEDSSSLVDDPVFAG